ncbi:MAG: DivIVA domain-containing protein [Clostridia bacterium]|nr:DivIVA domain-containing protein [Clostridia bacterium]
MINPQDLQNTEFSKSFKGYTCTEVDKYVEYVVEQYTELYRENAELEKRVKTLTAKLEDAKNDQSSISATIVNAQKMADEIIRDANEKAVAINSAIKSSFDEIVAQYRKVIELNQQQLFEAQKNAIDFKNGILDGYKQQVKLLCELIPLDSMESIDLKSVDEVVENAVAAAGEKLGVNSDSASNDEENDGNN